MTSAPKRGQAPGQPRLGRHLGPGQKLVQSDRATGSIGLLKKLSVKTQESAMATYRMRGISWERLVELLILNARRLILLSHSQNIILPVSDSFNVIETLGIFYKCP